MRSRTADWDSIEEMMSSVQVLCGEAGDKFNRQSDRVKCLITWNIARQIEELAAIMLSSGLPRVNSTLEELLPGFRSESLDRLRDEYGDEDVEGSPCQLIGRAALAPATIWRQQPDLAQALLRVIPLIDRVWEEIKQLRPGSRRPMFRRRLGGSL